MAASLFHPFRGEAPLDYDREKKYADQRIEYIDKQIAKENCSIEQKEKDELHRLNEKIKNGNLSKKNLLAIRDFHFAIVEQKVCRALYFFAKKKGEGAPDEPLSRDLAEIEKKLKGNPFDRAQRDHFMLLTTTMTIFKKEGEADDIALAKKIERLTKLITTPSPLSRFRDRAVDYRLADEYLISKQMLAKKRKGGAELLERYLAKKMAKYGPGGLYSDQLAKAREAYRKREREGKYGGLSDYMVKKVYRHAVIALSEQEDPKGGVHLFCPNRSECCKSSPHFLAGWREDSELIIVNWSGKIELKKGNSFFINEGACCIVQKAYIITKKIFAALKIAHPSAEMDIETARRALPNEMEKLSDLGEVEGVQERPLFHFQVTESKDCPDISATVGKLYNAGDLFSLLYERAPPPASDRAEMVLQLFKGLEKIASKDIIHGDIKLENILVDYDRDKIWWRTDIADFGDARYSAEFIKDRSKCTLLNIESGLGTAVTPSYFTREDAILAKQAVSTDLISEESWRDLQKKRDLFAAASSAWRILTGSPPYRTEDDKLELPITKYGTLRQHDIMITKLLGKESTRLLKEALSEDPHSRPTVAAVTEAIAEGVETLRKRKAASR